MEAVFVAILLGCSDDLVRCEELDRLELSAPSAEACSERLLGSPAVDRLDWPAVLVQCRPLDEMPPLAV